MLTLGLYWASLLADLCVLAAALHHLDKIVQDIASRRVDLKSASLGQDLLGPASRLNVFKPSAVLYPPTPAYERFTKKFTPPYQTHFDARSLLLVTRK